MRISAAFCREQETIQQARAEIEPLENQRNIARDAAKAWGEEAIAIEKRAAAPNARNKLDAAIALEFAREAATDGDLGLGQG